MNRLRRGVSLLVILVATGLAGRATSEELRGVALVIGAADYETLGDLGNSLNDARAMDEMLDALGFDVTRVLDRDSERMRREIEDFVDDAEGADVALVYYAGHAVEAAGQNYLVPIDADLGSPAAAGESLIPLADVLDELARTVPVTIMLLDACRSEAFPDGSAILLPGSDMPVPLDATGLGEMRGPAPVAAIGVAPDSLGMVIGFAAAPGQPALDGEPGGNSPYAAALLKHFSAGGYAFGDLMTLVTEEVYLKTGARQIPWVNSSLRRVLSFGTPVESSGDDEALIRDGRRQLLMSIATLPTDVRQQVESAASTAAVPMDTLFGLLEALGEDVPADPAELDQLLKTQTEAIGRMMAEREALTSTDTEIVRLADLAQRALDEGALTVSVAFWEKAKARYGEISASLDATEALLKERRLEGGALYARTAYAYGLSGDYITAADNFRLAHDEVARWDDGAAFEYKRLEAEAIYLFGVQAGNNDALAAAAAIYHDALSYVPSTSREWALVQREIGNSHAQLASRDANDASVVAAVAAYQAALGVFDRATEPQEWAMVQARLAAALSIQGEREQDDDTLVAAIEASYAALEVLSPQIDAYEWGLAQNNLGNTLRTLGDRQAEPQMLRAAADAFTAALSVSSVDTHAFDWAMIQNNLGTTLLLMGIREADRDMLLAASDSFSQALAVLERDRVPLQWAKAQGNLGAALMRLGEIDDDLDRLSAAADAFRAALSEATPERSLTDWATASTNLGNALTFMGQRGAGEHHLRDAVDIYREVARVMNRERAPLQWAQAHNNVGATLLLLGELGGGLPAFTQGIEALNAALEVWTRERVPLDWAMAQRNVGHLLANIGVAEEGTATLEAAAAAYRNAMLELTRERAASGWADMQYRLGNVLLEIGLRDPARLDMLEQAVGAYDAASTVYTREANRLGWADVSNARAWALASLGFYSGAPDLLQAARADIEAVWNIAREAGITGQDAYFSERLAIIDGALAEIAAPKAP